MHLVREERKRENEKERDREEQSNILTNQIPAVTLTLYTLHLPGGFHVK